MHVATNFWVKQGEISKLHLGDAQIIPAYPDILLLAVRVGIVEYHVAECMEPATYPYERERQNGPSRRDHLR